MRVLNKALPVKGMSGRRAIADGMERYDSAVDGHFSRIFKVYGHARTDHRLNLSQAPVRLVRMTDKIAR